jgi:hypothetical protein
VEHCASCARTQDSWRQVDHVFQFERLRKKLIG